MHFVHNYFLLYSFLMFGHFLADYPLQGEFISIQKNPLLPPEKRFAPWDHVMLAHGWIQAGFVLLFTGSLIFAICEFFIHIATDFAKCYKLIDFKQDQAVHLLCKIAWTLLTLMFFGLPIWMRYI